MEKQELGIIFYDSQKKFSQNVISVTSNWKLQGEALNNSIRIEGVEK
jgi:hypothetical protein